jgi:hypothetical protein
VNIQWLGVSGYAACGKLDFMELIYGAEERAGIEWENSMWLKKSGDEKFFRNTW